MSDGASQKPYELTLEQRPGYLYAYVEGAHDSYEISRAYWQEIADEVARRGVNRVLIDENIEETVSIAEIYELASQIPFMGFISTRVAFVDRYLEHHEVNSFAELVAVNRGMRGKVFNDLETAETWLMAD